MRRATCARFLTTSVILTVGTVRFEFLLVYRFTRCTPCSKSLTQGQDLALLGRTSRRWSGLSLSELLAEHYCKQRQVKRSLSSASSHFTFKQKTTVSAGVSRSKNLILPVLPGTVFMDRFEKSASPPECTTVPYNSDAVLMIATVTKTTHEQDQFPWKAGNIKEVTGVEIADKAARRIRSVCQMEILSNSKGILKVTTEARGLVQINALPDWYFMQASRMTTGNKDVFSKQPFHVLIIGSSEIPLYLPKHRRVSTSKTLYLPSFTINSRKCSPAQWTCQWLKNPNIAL